GDPAPLLLPPLVDRLRYQRLSQSLRTPPSSPCSHVRSRASCRSIREFPREQGPPLRKWAKNRSGTGLRKLVSRHGRMLRLSSGSESVRGTYKARSFRARRPLSLRLDLAATR